MPKLKHHFSFLVALATLLMTSITFGQTHGLEHDEGHELKKFRVAVYLGHSYIPAAITTESKLAVHIFRYGIESRILFDVTAWKCCDERMQNQACLSFAERRCNINLLK